MFPTTHPHAPFLVDKYLSNRSIIAAGKLLKEKKREKKAKTRELKWKSMECKILLKREGEGETFILNCFYPRESVVIEMFITRVIRDFLFCFFFFLKSISRELDELLGRFYLASCLVRASKSPKRSRLELVKRRPTFKRKINEMNVYW